MSKSRLFIVAISLILVSVWAFQAGVYAFQSGTSILDANNAAGNAKKTVETFRQEVLKTWRPGTMPNVLSIFSILSLATVLLLSQRMPQGGLEKDGAFVALVAVIALWGPLNSLAIHFGSTMALNRTVGAESMEGVEILLRWVQRVCYFSLIALLVSSVSSKRIREPIIAS